MAAIKSLQNIVGIIPHDKVSILLVHGGLKPSALIVMEGHTFQDVDHPSHISSEILDAIDAIFAELSIFCVKTFEVMEARESGLSVEVLRLFISREQQTAEELKLLFDDVSNNHTEIGHLLGYPSTAVDAFLTSDMLSQAETPKATEEVNELNMRLLGHRLSKDHWREEVKYLEQSGNYIKSISPLIYDEATREE